MEDKEIDTWLGKDLPKYKVLTNTVVNIVESLLNGNKIDYLTITGRTKTTESIKEKIQRKSYNTPETQMTDLSGIRIIAYFESDVDEISKIIEKSFCIDKQNSLSKDSLLAADQMGYRSIHYVCDLGNNRTTLPEFNDLNGMKFEFQIRTVLQHAWAELAHDRNYKFSGKLPKEIERKIYLYAGMLEIADKGFDEISSQMNEYVKDFNSRTNKGDYNIEINSISLEEYIEKWANSNNFELREYLNRPKSDFSDLICELDQMGVRTILELMKIIPDNYSEAAKKLNYSTTIHGVIRDWMLVHDYKKYHDEVTFDWHGFSSTAMFSELLTPDRMSEFYEIYKDHDFLDDDE
ncbi:MAG: GTP pyrophosphokinase [Gammaproteobacteria bacterium]|nr:GTP pyrophosphokinase [Gammaproteobacteria bacterium]